MTELSEKIEQFITAENNTTMKLTFKTKKGITCTAMRLRTAWADYVYDLRFDLHGKTVAIKYRPKHIRHVFDAVCSSSIISLGLVGRDIADGNPVRGDVFSWRMIVFAIENNMPLEVATLLTPTDLNGGKS